MWARALPFVIASFATVVGAATPAIAQDGSGGFFEASVQPGISVLGRAQRTVRAEEAYVVLQRDFFEQGRDVFSAEDRLGVTAGVVAAGVAADGIEFVDGDFNSSQLATVRVEVPVESTAELGPAVVSAVESVVGPLPVRGLELEATKRCRRVRGSMRKEAVDDARARAQSLAELGHVELGGVVDIVDQSAILGDGGDSCDPHTDEGLFYDELAALLPLGAEPVVSFDTRLAVTFSVPGASTRGVTAPGGGKARGRADDAVIVVILDPFAAESGPDTGMAERARAALVAAGYPDSEIESSPFAGDPDSASVRVHVEPSSVAADGPAIVATVESAVGATTDHGVVFSTQACPRLVRQAQRRAFRAADREIASLARASSVELGAVTSIGSFGGAALISSGFELEALFGGPCDTDAALEAALFEPSGPDGLHPFDQKPLAVVESGLTVTRAIRSGD